ncbi:metallophosphoesterase [Enterococcus sp. JM4C]|uniref:metallophosphoesterase n=1 Tax=Candidatus Enterococcus huntleyi TaxID=1857217 RepID=UPI00137B4038|nr:metallophosphoesterase [Enterococcus sp. JM4C]KAF1297898.1 metallophosphoesterase [Enterococcus sp. JM4C]
MGRLAIISDLHVDINHFTEKELQQLFTILMEQEVTHLHLAGDTANRLKTCQAVLDFFNHKGLATSFIFGNHELADVTGEAMMAHYPNVHFLNERFIPLNEKKVLLGFNGWYDYSYSTTNTEKESLRLKNLYWYDRFIQREFSDPEVNRLGLQRLEKILVELEEKGLEVVLATHFVPKREFIVYQTGKYQRWNQLNAFLGSEALGELIDRFANVQQVVFGHTHRKFEEQQIGNTLYSCRPLGYFYEWQLTRDFIRENQLMETFQMAKIRSVLKANQAAFDQYKEQHLKNEFQSAMTLIDY